MEVFFSQQAEAEFLALEKTLRSFFSTHIEKLLQTTPRRHMRFGMPFYVENITKQARLVYNFEGNRFIVLHCFALHKEYERWYRSFK